MKKILAVGFTFQTILLIFVMSTYLLGMGVAFGQDEKVTPRSNFDDARMILAFMLDRCWKMYADPISAGPDMKYTVPRVQEPLVDTVLSCVEGSLLEHRVHKYGVGQPDENEIKKAGEKQ